MAEVVDFTKRKACAVCGKPSDARLHPFCSNRCREVDLNRWLRGHYAIPVAEHDDDVAHISHESED